MKDLLLTLVAFSVLLLIGCQENSITDPIQNTELQKTDDPAVTTGTISLEGLLVLPGGFQTYFSIEGQINYIHELVLLDPAPPAPQYYIDLNLTMKASLNDGVNTFRILSQSEDYIYVSEDGIYLLEETFTVIGRNDGLVLVCRFLVTTDGIGLNAMWLELSDDPTTNELNKNVGPEPVTYPPVVNNQIN